jgi:hypothetical protein
VKEEERERKEREVLGREGGKRGGKYEGEGGA